MINSKTLIKQISPTLINSRFSFVEDELLRQNISNTFSYIAFLDSLEEVLDLPPLYKSMLYKTIIVYSASIVESLLYYKLKDQIFEKKFKYEELSKVIMKDELPFPLVLCKKLEEDREVRNNTQFQDLIKHGKGSGLLTESLYNHCKYIKDLRNKIHMAPMNNVDNTYTRHLINEVFGKVKKVIDRIEGFTSS